MKRTTALAPLSRDHHQALAAALVLRRATSADLGDAVRRFADFWAGYGERHFTIEEDLLLPALPAEAAGWSQATARVRREHDDIRRRARELVDSSHPPLEAARELGARLTSHVRFEERELFALLEDELPPDELRRLGRLIAAAEDESDRRA